MLHKTEIRNLALNILRNSSSVTSLVPANNIKNSKVTPFAGEKLPGINVWISRVNGTSRSINIMSFNYSVVLNVEIYVQSMDDWQDKADAIEEAVENALLSNQEFISSFTNIPTYDVETSQYGDGAKPIVCQILSFNLSYFEDFHPTMPTDDFDGVNIDVDVIEPIANPLPGPDGRIEFKVNAETNAS